MREVGQRREWLAPHRPVTLQAQGNTLKLQGKQTLTVASARHHLDLKCPGTLSLLAGKRNFVAPAGMSYAMPKMPRGESKKMSGGEFQQLDSKDKKILRIFWTYGKDEKPASHISRFYSDLNIHVETLNYKTGETVDINIVDNEGDEIESGITNINLSAIVQADGSAKIMNVLDK